MSEAPVVVHTPVTHLKCELAVVGGSVGFQDGSAMKPTGALDAKLDAHSNVELL